MRCLLRPFLILVLASTVSGQLSSAKSLDAKYHYHLLNVEHLIKSFIWITGSVETKNRTNVYQILGNCKKYQYSLQYYTSPKNKTYYLDGKAKIPKRTSGIGIILTDACRIAHNSFAIEVAGFIVE